MAKKKTKEEATAPVVSETETVGEETPPAEAAPVEESNVPEIVEGSDVNAETVEELLTDEADDLDIPEKEVPPVEEAKPPVVEGQEPPKAVVEPPKPAEASPEVAPTPPAEPKPAEAAPPPAVVTAPAQTPPVVPEAAPVTPEPAPTPTLTLEEVQEQYQESRAALEKQLSTEVYKLSDEQVQRLDDDDRTLIPELLAKVYMDAVTGAVAQMVTQLPNMMNSVITGRDQSSALEEQFYAAWPVLNKAEHGETAGRLGQAYRTLYPHAPAEQFISDVGAQTIVALKIPPTQGETPTPTTPEVPAPAKPFQPAGVGSSGGAAPAATNVFDVLATEMAVEELDMDL